MKTAIVLGATGLIGQNLTLKLAQQSHINKVIAVTRKTVDYSHPKIENQVVDFSLLEQYSQTFLGDILFSCLGTTKKQAGSTEAQRIIDVDYQLTAAKLAANNGVSEYFLVSSSGSNATSKNAYLQMKGELENKIMGLGFERICIFQPSLLLGERNHVRIGEKLGSWILPTLCKLPILKRFKPIYGAQVATKMCQVSAQQTVGIMRYTLDECFPK
ncbi:MULTISPECIES: NAD-dependent epimerase/dehydratase family protein [unclassified Pseudoalteromonas]|uniref:NAD-dependent epimerase/dehydratase family protein n=1 Tax=unclassified Pseudoalteromonas TaxID=194690 RepID=UPI0005A93F09|nr:MULTISPECIES: NAD-dependent epimerase/dehydratase family protein [unclassified Pseudoalteromonas]